MTDPKKAPRTGHRRLIGHLLALLVTALAAGALPLVVAWGIVGDAPWRVGLTASAGEGSGAVDCLDEDLRPASHCDLVEVEVDVLVDGALLTVVVRNADEAVWHGGPVAVEVPVPDPSTTAASGVAGPEAPTGEWVERASVVVTRCTFEPVARIEPGDEVRCALPRLGLAPGDHTAWLTGFTAAVPAVGDQVGDLPPAVGVVPVAASRSVSFTLGDEASSTSEGLRGGADDGGATGGGSAGRSPVAALVLVVGGVVLCGVLIARQRRSSPKPTP